MRTVRRLLQVVALVGTLLVGVVAVALIVSQTPWFRDWIRRYVVRESKQYLNGELSIGSIGGNLLFGVHVSDIAVDVSGERVVSAKDVEVDYSVFDLVSKGIVLNGIKLVEPVIRLERDGSGWNLNRLVKKQAKEADREGPRRPVTLQSIEVEDARVVIDDAAGTGGYRLPRQIEDLDLKASYAYEPVRYSVVVDRASIRASSPHFSLTEFTGKISVRDDNVYLDKLSVRTAESTLTVDGVIENYLATPVVKLTTSGAVSIPEVGRMVPAAAGFGLHPRFTITASGPAEKLALDVDVQSEAGKLRGQLTADVRAPQLAVRGAVAVERLDLAPLVRQPSQASDITGRATVDLRVSTTPSSIPFTDRLQGTFRFTGPSVSAAGYRAADVRASGAFDAGRITLETAAAAYGGTATARGFIGLPAGTRPLALDLRGSADDVDLRNLPRQTGAPRLATELSVAEYHVQGTAQALSGSAVLNGSMVEGAALASGTTATFAVAPGRITYSAKGSVTGLNLPRLGRALEVAAMQKPSYDGQLNGDFDVRGELPRETRPVAARGGVSPADPSRLTGMTIDASGTLRDSTILGGRLPRLAYEAHLGGGTLDVAADGRFENFDPAVLSTREALAGDVTGTLKVRVRLADITVPVTPEALTAEGQVALESSSVGKQKIEAATVQGKYADQVADLARLEVKGPGLTLDASGRLSLDRGGASDLKYRLEAADLSTVGALAGQPNLSGAATLDGTAGGNGTSLTLAGSVNGSNVAVGENKALDLNSTYSVTVPDLAIKRARVEADTTATFIKAGGLEINQLTARTTFEGERLQFTTSIKEQRRELDATGDVILHPDHQEVHLPQLAVRTQGVEWRSPAGSEATIKYGQERIEIENVRLASGVQSLDVRGSFAVKGDSPAGALEVRANDIDLRQLETLLLMERGLGGTLSADATISGTAKAPAVDGHVEIRNGSFRSYKFESLVADVDYAGTRMGVDATLQQSATESITAKGTVSTALFKPSPSGHVAETDADKVDLHVKSTALNLGIIQGFTNQVTNVGGTLEADVRITGSGQDPHLEGYVDIKNGAFAVPAGGVSYTGLNTRIELEPERLRLQKFAIVDEHGEPLNISGDLAVHARQVGAVDITIDSDNFEIIDNELGDVGIDSAIKITGELRRPRIEGSVRLEAARLEVDRILTFFYDPYSVEEMPAVVSAERIVESGGSALEATQGALRRAETTAAVPGTVARSADAPAPSGVFANLDLDMRLEIPDNLVLRGKRLRPGGPTAASLGDINITVGGDMQIVKPANSQMLLLGTVQTVRGTYEFQGRRFELARGGTLRFLGEPTPNPALDVTATRVIPNTGVEARVRIQGTVRAPQLSLTSTPPLEESDILALIVFNRPVNELGGGERASLAATAGGIATGFIAAPLGESIGRALDLDLFEISTTTDEGELGAGLTLGQQVGDRAFFKMRQQFGERSATEFLLEYQLARFVRLQTTAAPETSGSANRIGQRRIERAGIDLIFFFSY